MRQPQPLQRDEQQKRMMMFRRSCKRTGVASLLEKTQPGGGKVATGD